MMQGVTGTIWRNHPHIASPGYNYERNAANIKGGPSTGHGRLYADHTAQTQFKSAAGWIMWSRKWRSSLWHIMN